jgi:hypothetical protein
MFHFLTGYEGAAAGAVVIGILCVLTYFISLACEKKPK